MTNKVMLIMALSFLVAGCQTVQENSATDYERPASYTPGDDNRLMELFEKLPKSEATEAYFTAYFSKSCHTLGSANKNKYLKLNEVATKIYFEQPVKATASEERQYREVIDFSWRIQSKSMSKDMCNTFYTMLRTSRPDLF